MVLRHSDYSIKLMPHELGVYEANPSSGQAEIICETGVLLITRSGDREDHVLMPGERLLVNQGGKIVIEALREAQMRIASPRNAN